MPGCLLRFWYTEPTSWGENETLTTVDTVDITGDGIPDFISAGTTTSGDPIWTVLPGQAPSSTGSTWGFGPPRTWVSVPRAYIRRSETTTNFLFQGSNDHGSIDNADLIDMNGDGLLDFVEAHGQGLSVWLNNGSGFSDTPLDFGGWSYWNGQFDDQGNRIYYTALRFVNGSGVTLVTVADVTGDGLPDHVVAGNSSYDVYANTGRKLWSTAEAWALPSGCFRAGQIDGTRRNASSNLTSDPVRDVLDINGDGLPDIVDSSAWTSTNNFWQVCLNRGSGFAAPQAWASSKPVIRDND
ncbi:MAG: VCBS repeat-containing protein, partial [Deltaproteobacteria bacterium]|nr:VCBS repeat-containing protein [Deltaproteobacteria bacterium]